MSRLVFSEKIKKNFFECHLLQILLGALRVKGDNPLIVTKHWNTTYTFSVI